MHLFYLDVVAIIKYQILCLFIDNVGINGRKDSFIIQISLILSRMGEKDITIRIMKIKYLQDVDS